MYCDPITVNFILQNARSDITNIFESKNFNVQKYNGILLSVPQLNLNCAPIRAISNLNESTT